MYLSMTSNDQSVLHTTELTQLLVDKFSSKITQRRGALT